MTKNLSYIRNIIAEDDPSLAAFLEQREGNALLKAILENKQMGELGMGEIIQIIREAKKDALSPNMINELMEEVTPEKGVDYFTDEEIRTFIDHIQSSIRVPEDGKDGDTPTREQLVALIKPLIPKVKNGETPVKGVNYFTKEEVDAMVEEVLSKITAPPELDIEALTEKIAKAIKKGGKFQIEKKDIKDMRLDDQKWHGGGIVKISKDGTLVTNNALSLNFTGSGVSSVTNSNGVVTVTLSGGAGVSFETPVGTVNDSNTTFTVSNTPVYINVNGLIYTVGNGIFTSYSAPTITLSTPVGTGGFIQSAY